MVLKKKKLKNESPAPTPAAPAAANPKAAARRRRHVGAPRRFRVEIINENTLERAWSVKFKGAWAIVAAAGALAAMVSLVAVIFLFTPLGRFLPGQLEGDLRSRYMATALRVDSLERVAREQIAYTSNIIAILNDSLPEPAVHDTGRTGASAVVDSLISAGDAEQRFVRQFEQEQRFNLSVLSPIAAEGMIFEMPSETDTGAGPVAAVYRGSVVAAFTDADGFSSVVIQHPGDFISVYNDLEQVYVGRGDKVVAGQRIGNSTTARPLLFELWHSGTRLDPSLYIAN